MHIEVEGEQTWVFGTSSDEDSEVDEEIPVEGIKELGLVADDFKEVRISLNALQGDTSPETFKRHTEGVSTHYLIGHWEQY